MKKIILSIIFCLIFFGAGFIIRGYIKSKSSENIRKIIPIPKPLEAYTFDNLSKADVKPGSITIDDILEDNEKFSSYLFTFEFHPNPTKDELKKTTGMINIPKGEGTFPIILMLRGYVDQKIYTTGEGTKHAGNYYAEHGFATIAPDFLGYAGSDKEADNIFESRFQTYVTTLSLLKTLENDGGFQMANGKLVIDKIFLWGHSNGGQIALTVLEITGKDYPTVLWAPVSKPFPYSILYYTDESEDRGRLIRSELAKFESLYDAEKFSLTNYFDHINKSIKIQVHQGTSDEAVPKSWTDALVKTLLGLDLNLDYDIYPGADHNLQPSWNTVVERNLNFYRENLK